MPGLGHGFSIADLYQRESLVRLDGMFLRRLQEANPDLHQSLLKARSQPDQVTRPLTSEIAVGLGPVLDGFLAELLQPLALMLDVPGILAPRGDRQALRQEKVARVAVLHFH